MTVTIREAHSEDLDRVHAAYGAAFADEAVASWTGLANAPETYRDMLAEALDGADQVEVAEVDGHLVGVAVWMVLNSADRVRAEADQFATLAAERPELTRAATAMAAVAAQHPDSPHLFLPSMGVVPEHRGAGIGSAMLRHRLARAGDDATPVYLEASTRASARLYARHGFQPFGDPVQLPDSGPHIQPMLRPADAEQTAHRRSG